MNNSLIFTTYRMRFVRLALDFDVACPQHPLLYSVINLPFFLLQKWGRKRVKERVEIQWKQSTHFASSRDIKLHKNALFILSYVQWIFECTLKISKTHLISGNYENMLCMTHWYNAKNSPLFFNAFNCEISLHSMKSCNHSPITTVCHYFCLT